MSLNLISDIFYIEVLLIFYNWRFSEIFVLNRFILRIKIFIHPIYLFIHLFLWRIFTVYYWLLLGNLIVWFIILIIFLFLLNRFFIILLIIITQLRTSKVFLPKCLFHIRHLSSGLLSKLSSRQASDLLGSASCHVLSHRSSKSWELLLWNLRFDSQTLTRAVSG